VVIPVYDSNPVRRTPVVTYLLILINVAVFLTEPIVTAPVLGGSQSFASVCQQTTYFDRYAAIPRELISNEQLPPRRIVVATDEGDFACPVQRYAKTPVFSVLYAMFLHGGWLHLLGNMLFLFVFGNNVEDRLGRLRYLLFYLFCGYAAAYGFALADANGTTTLVGASGAIAGVLGAYLVLYPRARVVSVLPFLFFLPLRLPAWLVLGSWFLLQYFYSAGAAVSAGAGVAYLAHVVGFVVGFGLAWPLRGRRPPPPRRADPWRYGY